MTVNSISKAWETVNEVFPTDYEKDSNSSARAGYNIYRSTAEDHYYDYICDLGNRLEVNLSSGKTINIWIIEEAAQDEKPQETEKQNENKEMHIEVIVSTVATGEKRHYKNYGDFIEEWRFHHSGGKECLYKDSSEAKFNKMRDILIREDDHGDSMTTTQSGLNIELIYYKWRRFDRYMKNIEV